jgi:hypothetical protein
MDKEQLEKIGKAAANLVHFSTAWDNPLDGDETEGITKAFLKELNQLNGNI